MYKISLIVPWIYLELIKKILTYENTNNEYISYWRLDDGEMYKIETQMNHTNLGKIKKIIQKYSYYKPIIIDCYDLKK